jgi:hypothetical protein
MNSLSARCWLAIKLEHDQSGADHHESAWTRLDPFHLLDFVQILLSLANELDLVLETSVHLGAQRLGFPAVNLIGLS